MNERTTNNTSPGTTLPVGGASTERKNTEKSHKIAKQRKGAGAEGPSFKRAQAKREHLKVALLEVKRQRLLAGAKAYSEEDAWRSNVAIEVAIEVDE